MAAILPAGFSIWIPYILEDEGPELNISPDEPGGASKYGVSVKAYRDFLMATTGNNVIFAEDVLNQIKILTNQQATTFYAWYFNAMLFDQIPAAIAYRLADVVTNLGRYGGVECLSVAMGLHPLRDKMDDDLVARIRAADPAILIGAISAAWLGYKYGNVQGWLKYGNGWTARRNRAHNRALAILSAAKGTDFSSLLHKPPPNMVSR